MQGGGQRIVQLQQRLATGADNIGTTSRFVRPFIRNRASERLRVCKASAADTVRAHEIGVAEGADRVCPILLPAAPQIAAGEAQEHRGAAGARALALQGVKYLLHLVTHGAMYRSYPCARKRQAGQRPQPYPQSCRLSRVPR